MLDDIIMRKVEREDLSQKINEIFKKVFNEIFFLIAKNNISVLCV